MIHSYGAGVVDVKGLDTTLKRKRDDEADADIDTRSVRIRVSYKVPLGPYMADN